MKSAIVLSVNGSGRSASITYPGALNAESFIIPPHIPTPVVGCQVLADTENKIIVAVIDYPDTSHIDPFTDGTPAGNTQINNKHPGITRGGDFILKTPKSGYLALLDGFIGILGGSPLAQIMAIGTKRLVRVIADNLRFEGSDYSFTINEGANSLPTLNFQFGAMVCEIIGGSEIRFAIGEQIKLVADKERITLSLLNRSTGFAEPVYSYGYAKFETDETGKKVIKTNFNLSDTIAQMTSLVLKIDSAIDVSFKKGMRVKGDNMDISMSGTQTLSAKDFKQTVTGDSEVKAGNALFEIGTNGSSGSFQVLNGTLSKLEMDSTGMVKIKGLPAAGIQLNGNEDFAVYATELYKILLQIIVTIQNMGTALSPCPITAAAGAAGTSIVSVLPMLPNMVNPAVTYGKPLNPKL